MRMLRRVVKLSRVSRLVTLHSPSVVFPWCDYFIGAHSVLPPGPCGHGDSVAAGTLRCSDRVEPCSLVTLPKFHVTLGRVLLSWLTDGG